MNAPGPADPDEQWLTDRGRGDYESAIDAGKRIGVRWAPWMGDWFTSWSPRNDNSNAEGEWEQWVDLALRILADPLTALVRPDVHQPAPVLRDTYTGARRALSASELRSRFEDPFQLIGENGPKPTESPKGLAPDPAPARDEAVDE